MALWLYSCLAINYHRGTGFIIMKDAFLAKYELIISEYTERLQVIKVLLNIRMFLYSCRMVFVSAIEVLPSSIFS